MYVHQDQAPVFAELGLDFGLTITPGAGVEDITEAYVKSGATMPTPGPGPAAPSTDKTQLLDTTGPIPEEVVAPAIGDAFKAASKSWYKSPWLWGGAAVLVLAAATAVVWSRRTA